MNRLRMPVSGNYGRSPRKGACDCRIGLAVTVSAASTGWNEAGLTNQISGITARSGIIYKLCETIVNITMKRIATLIVTSILLFLGAIGLWYCLDQPLYAKEISPRCKLIIRQVGVSGSKSKFYVTFHYPPAIGMFGFAEFDLERPVNGFDFTSVMDENSRIQCIYDANGSGFIFLYDHRRDDQWITGNPTGYCFAHFGVVHEIVC